ncbi:hypothetical protein T4C_6391 [Trichinella pseudospiralis]|uniref:Uncharacterized protein n=1 Tax=Trichinella pseudospiralis TaxID=6337 RepID=A0A0V1IYP7_TRIPS|nr:hypothetical protein T4C_6391 [Trichinella pseudospiralis]
MQILVNKYDAYYSIWSENVILVSVKVQLVRNVNYIQNSILTIVKIFVHFTSHSNTCLPENVFVLLHIGNVEYHYYLKTR